MNAPAQQQRPNAPNGAPAQPMQPAPFRFNVTRGAVAGPPRIVIHGAPGIGKSTLAACAPAPLFLDLEHGTLQMDVARVDNIDNWEALITTVRALATEPHDFKTLVIDTLDRAEWLCWQYVCRAGRKVSIEEFGFGKGYVAAYEQFRVLASALETLRNRRGMAIVIIAHSKIEKAPNAAGEEYDRWTLKVDKRTAGLFYEMFDAVLFARLQVFTRATESGRVKGFGDARVLETQEAGAWLAKNRYAMPRQIPLTWDDLASAMDRGADAVLESMRAEALSAAEKLAQLDADAGAAARAAVEGARDVAGMGAVLGRINGGIAKRAGERDQSARVAHDTNLVAQEEGRFDGPMVNGASRG